MAPQPVTLLTEEDYLRLERAAEGKSEFVDGEMYAMSGWSANHPLISVSSVVAFQLAVPKGCRVFNSDMRVIIPPSEPKGRSRYVYPDCSVVCGEPSIHDGDNLGNPQLIVEVLSPSTESYDRGKKFELYRRLPSFTDYLVIHQDARRVEYHAKQPDGGWLMHEYAGAEAVVRIDRWGIEVKLADLYATAIGLDE